MLNPDRCCCCAMFRWFVRDIRVNIVFADAFNVDLHGGFLVGQLSYLGGGNRLCYPMKQRPYHFLNLHAGSKRIHQKGQPIERLVRQRSPYQADQGWFIGRYGERRHLLRQGIW